MNYRLLNLDYLEMDDRKWSDLHDAKLYAWKCFRFAGQPVLVDETSEIDESVEANVVAILFDHKWYEAE